MSANELSLDKFEKNLAEAVDSLWDSFVDPREAYFGDGRELWSPLSIGSNRSQNGPTLPQLSQLRD